MSLSNNLGAFHGAQATAWIEIWSVRRKRGHAASGRDRQKNRLVGPRRLKVNGKKLTPIAPHRITDRVADRHWSPPFRGTAIVSEEAALLDEAEKGQPTVRPAIGPRVQELSLGMPLPGRFRSLSFREEIRSPFRGTEENITVLINFGSSSWTGGKELPRRRTKIQIGNPRRKWPRGQLRKTRIVFRRETGHTRSSLGQAANVRFRRSPD